MALYQDVFRQDLEVTDDFLQKYSELIRQRLSHAAEEFKSDHANMFAINMCLHAASSIILSHPQHMKAALDRIRATDGLKQKDATTVLTVSSLYYLVEWDAGRAATEKTPEAQDYRADLDRLRRGFDEINWLIGEEAMQVLGLRKAS